MDRYDRLRLLCLTYFDMDEETDRVRWAYGEILKHLVDPKPPVYINGTKPTAAGLVAPGSLIDVDGVLCIVESNDGKFLYASGRKIAQDVLVGYVGRVENG